VPKSTATLPPAAKGIEINTLDDNAKQKKIYKIGKQKKTSSQLLEITYIANEGFMISNGKKKVLIDALQRNPWDYVSTPEPVLAKMIHLEPPFKKLDLVIVSHAHRDHFEPGMVSRVLSHHPEAVFVSSQDAIDELKKVTGEDYSKISSQVRNVNPPWKSMVKLTVNGIEIKMAPVNHGESQQSPYLTLASLINLDGIKLFHLADLTPSANLENLKALQLQNEGIDIAFIDPFFLEDPNGKMILENHIKPGLIILMHLRTGEIEKYEKKLMGIFPNLIIFKEPMEKKLFQ
jgi:L-ascorbate metabolism protein UlaG (beta-lactamase superfamily)